MAVKINNSSTSWIPNVASALCYIPVIGWIASVFLLLAEKDPLVKWNATQSLLLSLLLILVFYGVGLLLGMQIVLAWLVPLVMVAGLVLNLILAVKAYQGSNVRLPVLSVLVDKVLKKA